VVGWFDIEHDVFTGAQRGWYSEQSVHEFLYDLVDDGNDPNGADIMSVDFGVLFGVFAGKFGAMRSLTSLFPFVAGLLQAEPQAASTIELLLAEQAIGPVTDDYGSGEQNDAGAAESGDVLPIYADVAVGGPAVNVCSTSEFGNETTGVANKLGTRRFVRFTPPPGIPAVTIRATATVIPAGHYADPDFILHDAGLDRSSVSEPSAACKAFDAPGWQPSACFELSQNILLPVQTVEYILEVYEWTNAFHDLPGELEPIGRTCFDVTVTP
jgi:hypothetical protein